MGVLAKQIQNLKGTILVQGIGGTLRSIMGPPHGTFAKSQEPAPEAAASEEHRNGKPAVSFRIVPTIFV